MVQAGRTFRIFVSSTFSDMEEERNALHEHVFPRLRELCMQENCGFQAIDLRWGVSEEAGLDQQTMQICLEEISRCQNTTPRPNFIALLGNRYGWCPLPYEIPESEYRSIESLISNKEEQELIAKWYMRDDNSVPPVYCLQSRLSKTVVYPPVGIQSSDYDELLNIIVNQNDISLLKKCYLLDIYADPSIYRLIVSPDSHEELMLRKIWELWDQQVERKLRAIFQKTVSHIGLPKEALIKYQSSATEQEIIKGALNVKDAEEHVFCFFRNIKNLPHKRVTKDFIDLDAQGKIDMIAQDRLNLLKKTLVERFNSVRIEPSNSPHIYNYDAEWTERGISTNHISKLREDVYQTLSRVISSEIDNIKKEDLLNREISVHEDFLDESTKFFTGRSDILENIDNYLNSKERHLLCIYGTSGSGKTTLMAAAIKSAFSRFPSSVVVYNFAGKTGCSADGLMLLRKIYKEVRRRYGLDELSIPKDYNKLIDELPVQLAVATSEKPLIIFIDAVEKIELPGNIKNLNWIPVEPPENVKFIISTLPGEQLNELKDRLPDTSFIEIKPMDIHDGEELLEKWLISHKRTLQKHQKEEILNNFSKNGLPLYLKFVFEQSKHWKSFTPLTKISDNLYGIIDYMLENLYLSSCLYF